MSLTFSIGDELGDYEIVAELDVGGMAELFLGRVRAGTKNAGRPVAIKAIRPEYSTDPSFLAMFRDEARIVSRIDHPHVVRVLDWGRHERKHFLVMEYLHGVSLSGLLRRLYEMGRTLTPAAAAALAVQAARGMHAAHELRGSDGELLQVIHRDISPQNIMVTSSGEAKVIDFGIVKALGRSARTSLGQIKGKIRYMSPEQMSGAYLDRRADIFALGVVLWETLATRRLYGEATDAEVITRAARGELPPPGSVADVPFALDRVVMKALRADPADRFRTAEDFAAAIVEAEPAAREIDAASLRSLAWGVVGADLDKLAARLPIDLPTRETVGRDSSTAVRSLTRMLDAEVEATAVGTLEDYVGDKRVSPLAPPPAPATPAPIVPVLAPPAAPKPRRWVSIVQGIVFVAVLVAAAYAAYAITRSL
ncbi:MAG: serine/threonine-protein kinase [Myxococcota bacterium]